MYLVFELDQLIDENILELAVSHKESQKNMNINVLYLTLVVSSDETCHDSMLIPSSSSIKIWF